MRKGLLAVLGLIMLAGVAWWAGATMGELLSAGESEERIHQRQEVTRTIIEQNQAITIGSKWPDPMLQNLDGDWKRISEVLSDTTLLIVIRPGCDACETELDVLDDLLRDKKSSRRAIIISDAYPLDLTQVRQARGIKSEILVDRERELFQKFSLIVFPMNVLIAPDRTILSVTAGGISRDQAEQTLR